MNDDQLFWLWMQDAVGPGSADVPKLLQTFGSARTVYEAERSDLQRAGVMGRRLDNLCHKSLDKARKQRERSSRLGWMLTPDNELYPAPLHNLYSPPLVLYGVGKLPSFSQNEFPAISIVGTRRSTAYGNATAGALAAGLAAVGCPIISGGARGIDRAAHEGALYASGHTVVVQACGLDVNYPRPNYDMRQRVLENGGAIITEFAPETRVFSSSFHIRNRLISGLSKATCVVEAPNGSGALITAHAAMEQGREVFVMPGRVTDETSDGSHALIREGAVLVTRPSQILQECVRGIDEKTEKEADRAQAAYYDWVENHSSRPIKVTDSPIVELRPVGDPVPCPDYASQNARRVYDALDGKAPQAVEALCDQTAMEPGEIFAALTELELYGCVESCPGKRYTITRK